MSLQGVLHGRARLYRATTMSHTQGWSAPRVVARERGSVDTNTNASSLRHWFRDHTRSATCARSASARSVWRSHWRYLAGHMRADAAVRHCALGCGPRASLRRAVSWCRWGERYRSVISSPKPGCSVHAETTLYSCMTAGSIDCSTLYHRSMGVQPYTAFISVRKPSSVGRAYGFLGGGRGFNN